MITITTGSLVNLLADAAMFACPHDDIPDLYAIRLEWDEEALHASATDLIRSVHVSWDPEDDEGTGTLEPHFGGDDARWVMFIRLDEAQEIVSHFKLPFKLRGTPLTVNHRDGLLTIHRSRSTGHQEVKVIVPTQVIQFPDLSGLRDRFETNPAHAMNYHGTQLADFTAIRQAGDLTFLFDAVTGLTCILKGRRFVGTLRPDPARQVNRPALIEAGAVSG
jgi:hypothetical protein